MRYLLAVMCVCALGAIPLIGCGENGGEGGSGGTAGTGGMGGAGGTGGAITTAVTALVTGYDPAQGGFLGPLEGVELCIVETGDCLLTNAEGSVTTEAPVGEEISVTFEKEGYMPYLIPFVVPEAPATFTLGMGSLSRFEFLYGLVMSPYPPEGTGSIVITADPPIAGVTFALSDATAKAFYYDEEGNWDADLTETTSWGWGGFTEVSPGEVQVEIGGAAQGCTSTAGWPGDAENTFMMPIRAGYNNQISVVCNAP